MTNQKSYLRLSIFGGCCLDKLKSYLHCAVLEGCLTNKLKSYLYISFKKAVALINSTPIYSVPF